MPDILEFHGQIMTSQKALRLALEKIRKVHFSIIAPQHGSIIRKSQDANTVLRFLLRLKDVGIDRILPEDSKSIKNGLKGGQ